MTCGRPDSDLSALLDGTLRPMEAAIVEAHLATCARCQAIVADLRMLRVAAESLTHEEPPPHVWAALSRSLAREAAPRRARGVAGLLRRLGYQARVLPPGSMDFDEASSRSRAPRVWRPVAACAVALVLAVGLIRLGSALAPLGTPLAGPGGPAAPTGVDGSVTAEIHMAQQQYTELIDGLQQAIAGADRDAIDPRTADVLQANLTVLDQAIGESRAALDAEPGSQIALVSLFEALGRKLTLLQEMLFLINEMRKGNQEEAARIASELKP